MFSQNKTKNHSFKEIAYLLFEKLAPYKGWYIFGLSLGLLEGFLCAAFPLYVRSVMNSITTDSSSFYNEELTSTLLLGVLIVCVYAPSVYFFHTICYLTIHRVLKDLKLSLYTHLQKLSANFYHTNKIGEITIRISSDLENGVRDFLNVFMMIAWHCSVFLFSVAMMISIDTELTLLFLVFSTFVAMVTRYMLPKIKIKSRAVADADGHVSSSITEFLGASELVRAFSMEGDTYSKVHDEVNSSLKHKEKFIWFQCMLVDLIQILCKFIAPFGILLYGGYLVHINRLVIGDLVAFLLYWGIAGNLISAFSNQITNLFSGLASLDRVMDFYDETPLVKDLPNANELQTLKGDISFEDITFNYPVSSEETILKNMNLNIQAGQTIALVGPSGAGKSTIVQLLLRFYDPLSGEVKFDGKNIKKFSQTSIRKNIGIVMQESIFFSGSIIDNMRFAKNDATEDEIKNALKKANALDFVTDFKDGIHTILGERGAKISGGQKQRLSIARVFLKNPSVVILDEATSALDSISEMQIQTALDNLLKDRTAIIIAHRIATIKNADKIYVVEKGNIQSHGNHEELFQSSPLYKKICENQGLTNVA